MLFNSFLFLFIFLPSVTFIYFKLLGNKQSLLAIIFLISASLFYYAWYKVEYLPLLIGSCVFNYLIGSLVSVTTDRKFLSKILMFFGVLCNVALLGYFKYTDFFIVNINGWFNTDYAMMGLALPLAISYFTFQQIAYLVDSYRGETQEYDFVNYLAFITFFPQLLMGPIMHHKEIIPQFKSAAAQRVYWDNISAGVFIFSIGLAKKTLLADPLSDFAEAGFSDPESLGQLAAWFASLSYVLAYYFDLSGYADMAIGIGRMFNIVIPINFNSPYKSRNFADYWRRWHMTLSRFLSDYVYKSLGPKDRSFAAMMLGIMITFLVSGIWHGAGWTFLVWGGINGVLVCLAHCMKKLNWSFNFYIAWLGTFICIVVTRVLFVSDSFENAWTVTSSLFDIYTFNFEILKEVEGRKQAVYLLLGMYICFFRVNSIAMLEDFKRDRKTLFYTAFLLGAGISTFMSPDKKDFLYFQF